VKRAVLLRKIKLVFWAIVLFGLTSCSGGNQHFEGVPKSGFKMISGNIGEAQSSLPILLQNGEVLFEPQVPDQKDVILYSPKTNTFRRAASQEELKIVAKDGSIYVNQTKIISPYSKGLLSFINYHFGYHLSRLPEFSSQQYSLVCAQFYAVCTSDVFCKSMRKYHYPTETWLGYSVAKLAEPHLWLITGGLRGEQNQRQLSAKSFLFDTKKKAFINLPDLHFARYGHTSITLPDGRVVILGGDTWTQEEQSEGKSHTLKIVEIFDPKSRSFHKAGMLKNGFSNHGSILLERGKILIFGGEVTKTGDWSSIEQKSAELYDPVNGTSQEIFPMKEGRAQSPFAIRLLSGNILITGGMFGTTDAEYSPEMSAEVYTP
jgi:hypothetical protein